ncbi:MAG: hypothetical protein A3J97_16725 [Spirochaetes bacterium RIFOXYC1_FULL_54_7]|nr:MAG: hypothetical protein A3J97_16725 [Spirochaetes bacterium RIFOXYC1_FULL_54_7]
MRRILFLFLLCSMMINAAFGQSVDVSLDSSVSASKVSEKMSISATQVGTLSAVLPTSSRTKVILKGGATLSYTYSGETGEGTVSYPSEANEFDLQEASWNFGSTLQEEKLDMLTVALGRIPYTDPTGSLYSYRLDGLSLSATYGRLTIQSILGYTGFLPESDTILNSTSDSNYGTEGFLPGFAPPRAVAAFTLKPPSIARHELYASFIAQEDLRDDADLVQEYETVKAFDKSGPADKAYVAIGFAGPQSSPIAYSAYTTVQLGRVLSYVEDQSSLTGFRYLYAPVKAFSLGGQLRMAINPRINLALRLQYGSGDPDADTGTEGNADGDSTLFIPITQSSTGLVFSPQAGNVSLLSATLSGKPFPSVALGPKAITLVGRTFLFAKNGEGPISEAGVDPSAGFSLLGIEQDITATARLLSDLNASLSLGTFIPFSTPFGAFDPSYVEASPLQLTIRAGLALAL